MSKKKCCDVLEIFHSFTNKNNNYIKIMLFKKWQGNNFKLVKYKFKLLSE